MSWDMVQAKIKWLNSAGNLPDFGGVIDPLVDQTIVLSYLSQMYFGSRAAANLLARCVVPAGSSAHCLY
jgi:hypothetical protein